MVTIAQDSMSNALGMRRRGDSPGGNQKKWKMCERNEKRRSVGR